MRSLICTLLFVCVFQFANAQDGLPPNPEDGKCYAKCVTKEEWKTETVKVLKKPAYKILKVVPATYKTVEETIVVKEKSKKFIYVPATYKTVYDTVVIEEGYNKLNIVPASFKDDIKTLEVKPKTGRWVMGKKDPNCKDVDPSNCRILHYREYPSQSAYVPIQNLDEDAGTEKNPIDPKYKVIARKVIDKPAHTVEEDIPEQTITVKRRVLVKDETTVAEEVPAVYEEVTKDVLVKEGGLTVWKEVPCDVEPVAELIPILYKLGSAQLTEVSKKIIDERLYTMLKDNPDMRIELSSHTDSRGSASANQNLSQRRAESVVTYLVNKGISRSRLVAKGYGESKLLNNCKDGVSCPETEHQKNRRTEFRILN